VTGLLTALGASVTRLRSIVEGFEPDQLRAHAYPAEWSVADVLSHVGSAGVIMLAHLDAGLAGRDLPGDLAQSVWDEWNAKDPDAKAADALVVDRAFLDRVAALDANDQARVRVTMGPITFDLTGLLRARLNEHALHTWDVEVVLDPNATLPSDAAAFVVENLEMIVRYVGKPDGTEREIAIRTFDPERDFILSFGKDSLALAPAPSEPRRAPDLGLPAEAFARLVYGRLDPDHTPPVRGAADLDDLRRAFPGV